MPSTPVAVQVPLEPHRKPTSAQVEVEPISVGGRVWNLAKFWLICWIVALPLAPIPVVHFTVVPALLFAGPILGLRAFRSKVKVTSGSLTCPRCAKTETLREPVRGWPAKLSCPACGVELQLSPQTEAVREIPSPSPAQSADPGPAT